MKEQRLLAFLLWFLLSSLTLAQRDGDVYLSGTYKGLLAVYYSGRAGSVCDDMASPGTLTSLGQVACRNLQRSFVSAKGGQGGSSSSFYLDDMNCAGTESNLDECRHDSWKSENCGTNEHIYLTCSDMPCDGQNHNCSQICNNLPTNSFNCSCNAGYTLAADGVTCEDIDECEADNDGCSHSCINTIGSFYCDCPRYLYLSDDNSTCTADGFDVDCSSPFGMTITLERKRFFFLPDSLTLLNTSCTSVSNSTHIWLYSDYDTCGTVRKVDGSYILYTNAVLDSKTSTGGIRFFESIKIPFQCRLAINSTLSQKLKPVANRLLMRIENTGYFQESLIKLLSGDMDTSPELSPRFVKQGDVIYAKLMMEIEEVRIDSTNCSVLSVNRLESQKLIENGIPVNFLTKLLPSSHVRFSYPVFTFTSGNKTLHLDCDFSIRPNQSLINSVNSSEIVLEQEITAPPSDDDVTGGVKPVIVDNSKGVLLKCGPKIMTLTIDPSLLYGISIHDLQPLRQDCFGFSSWVEGGKYKYNIPLVDCGADVKTNDSWIIFTNSLVYSNNMTSQVKYFSDVVLTHSCKYPSDGYNSTLTYSVKPNNYTFGAENTQRASFDVSLNVFSDADFQNLISNGGAASIKEGQRLFGNIGITSSDPNVKVALDDCKVTPTNDPDDSNNHLVIENGCQTAYGSTVLSSDRFSLLTRSFTKQAGDNVFLHCSVVVCDQSNMSRCTRSCQPNKNVIGKRTEAAVPTSRVVVSAGPFFIQ